MFAIEAARLVAVGLRKDQIAVVAAVVWRLGYRVECRVDCRVGYSGAAARNSASLRRSSWQSDRLVWRSECRWAAVFLGCR